MIVLRVLPYIFFFTDLLLQRRDPGDPLPPDGHDPHPDQPQPPTDRRRVRVRWVLCGREGRPCLHRSFHEDRDHVYRGTSTCLCLCVCVCAFVCVCVLDIRDVLLLIVVLFSMIIIRTCIQTGQKGRYISCTSVILTSHENDLSITLLTVVQYRQNFGSDCFFSC